jgi:hypothetical protein
MTNRSTMATAKIVADIATVFARGARDATTKEIAAKLWSMAKQYQAGAAKLDGGKLLDIGDPPILLEESS